jgi:excinuclease ABC subunit C
MKLADTTPEQYRERVEMACEFMGGKTKELLDVLDAEMRSAAEKLDFERAAELRNMLDDLRQTTKPMTRYTTTMRHRLKLPGAINPVADLAALGEELGLSGPPRRMECFDISNISTTHVVASMVCFLDGKPANHLYRRYRIKTLEGRQDDFASMAEVVRRRYTRVLRDAASQAARVPSLERDDGMHIEYAPELSQEKLRDAVKRVSDDDPAMPRLPDLIIVDGGKGQLSSACAELQQLGLYEVPIIGLAKEFEEIYRPSRTQPLRLSHESGALKLLQRIRDEAHRWANGYHQVLMKRRVSESLLDECPGVSESRKQTLLRHFGSVARIRRAATAEIAALSGISPSLAKAISNFLRERV